MDNNIFDIGKFVNVETEQSVSSNLVKRFKMRRKEIRLSQQELAKRSGVSYSSIKRFEQTGDVSFSSLLKIAGAIDCLEDFNKVFTTPKVLNLKDLRK
ncbi:MAG: helix-turn-helix transcriptional regulator [Clostridia bacterium]|jgi:transcriptional regulator with XRE-family HTH domain|nr:helix-turn-helix transcriptional regulator [Clostridia bacterium]